MLFKFYIFIFHVFKDKQVLPSMLLSIVLFSPSKRVSLLFKLSFLYCFKSLTKPEWDHCRW